MYLQSDIYLPTVSDKQEEMLQAFLLKKKKKRLLPLYLHSIAACLFRSSEAYPKMMIFTSKVD